MNIITTVTAILSLVAGVGIFLIACSAMSSNLESVSSNRLKSMFAKASGSKLLGVGIGTVATAAIQSSGATTVMVIGFVNAGIMSLAQAATIIYGANIGTTITGQIVALGMFGSGTISTTVIFSACAGIGAFISSFAKKDTVKKVGGIISGFGMLFVGLSMMSSAMENFAQLQSVRLFLSTIRNEFLLVLIGAVFTAVVQSSSVMTSVAITMTVSGLINIEQGIFLTMGSNIGSCVVALIAGLTGSRNAKRTSLLHLIFNVSGVALFMILHFVTKIISHGSFSFGILLENIFPEAPQTQLAMFHTVFNLLTVVFVLPATNFLVKLVTRLVPEKQNGVNTDEPHMFYIDENMLASPAVAVQQTKKEIIKMLEIAMENFSDSIELISTMKNDSLEKFRKNENQLNYTNAELVKFIVRIPQSNISETDRIFLSTAFHSITDIERIGDYAENITEYYEALKADGSEFSDIAKAEIAELDKLIKTLYRYTMKAYIKLDKNAYLIADKTEEQIDDITENMSLNHIDRLNKKICTPVAGAQYLSLASDAERVADHLINVAKSILQYS